MISIVTVNYNNAVGLERTLKSVSLQNHSDIEHIIIDGASTDGSVGLIEQYSKSFSQLFRIAYVSEKDSGVYEAMNKGIKLSHGDYLIFMNSGDRFWNENVVASFSSRLSCDVVVGSVVEDGSDRIIRYPNSTLRMRTLMVSNFPHQAMFIRRELFSRIGYYSEDIKVLSDLEFNLKAWKNSISVKLFDEHVAFVEPGGLSNRDQKALDAEYKKVLGRVLSKPEIFVYRTQNSIENLVNRIRRKYSVWKELDVFQTIRYRYLLKLGQSSSLHVFPHSIVHIAPSSKLKIEKGCFRVNSSWFEGRERRSVSELRLMPGSELVVKDSFSMYQGASLFLARDSKMLIKGNCFINTNTVINCFSYIEIGEGTMISDDVRIQDSDNHDIVENGCIKEKSDPIIIGDHVWIGKNVLILKGVHVGNGAIIAAGSVVIRDVPSCSLVAGNPAVVKKDYVQWK